MALQRILPFLLLSAVALIWGSSFILIKRGLEQFDNLQVAALRLCFAGVFMLPFTLRYVSRIKKTDIGPLVVVALFGNGFPYFFFAYAQTALESGVTGALNSAVPLFTLVISAGVLKIPASTHKKVGVFIGLIGALMLVLSVSNDTSGSYIHGLWVIAATICYAISINVLKMRLSHYPPLLTSSIPLTFTAIPLLIYLPFFNSFPITALNAEETNSLAAVAILGIVGTAIALIIFNRLIQLKSAVFASSVTYLIPVVALIWGFVDGEQIGFLQIAGLLVVLLGIYLVNRKEKPVLA